MPLYATQDKQEFDTIITDVPYQVDRLEPRDRRRQTVALQRDLVQIRVHDPANTTIERLPNRFPAFPGTLMDPRAAAAAAAQQQATNGTMGDMRGHAYKSTVTKDKSRLINGNVDFAPTGFLANLYDSTQTGGESKVVQGNVSAPAAMAFFK